MLKKTGKEIIPGMVLLLSLAFICLMPTAGICFEVTARVDKNRISKDDSLVLNVEVEGGKAQLDLSTIKDFKVISRGTTSSMNYINGKLERKATYQYVLIPLKQGRLLIPPIRATMDGETKSSAQIEIGVSEKMVDPDEAKALFAVSEVSKESVFVGEQLVYTLKFFTSKRLSGLGYETPPSFEGFSSKSFEKEKTYISNINGIQYQVTEVNYILIPTVGGNFKIEPAVLIANVIVKSRRDPRFDSFFNDSFFSSNSYKPVRISSSPVEIQVSPLPVYEGKEDVSGLVGEFDIEAGIDTIEIKAGDSSTLTLKISGKGNIMDAGLPDMDLDEQIFKTYDDNPVENIALTHEGYEGYKIFKKAIVPVRSGQFLIKPVELIYFDVNQKQYQKVFTAPIQLNVLPSGELHQVGPPSQTLSPQNKIVKKEVHYENKDIFEIKEGLEVLEDHRDLSPVLFAICMMIPAFLFSGLRMFASFKKKDVPVRKQMEEKAKYHFKQAKKMGHGDNDKFLGHLYSSLVAVVLSKGSQKGETITMEETRNILRNAEVEDKKVEECLGLFETIESVRFGNKKIDENRVRAMLTEVKQVMKILSIAFICACLFWFSPLKIHAGENPTADFIEGINRYKAGDYEASAQLFEAVARADIKNPYLFYNIGNAYLKAENIGLAILWYERAKNLMPGDPDLNFNLEHAKSFVADKKEGGTDVLATLFFWDNFFKVKTIQISAIVFCVLFFLWASVRTLKQQRVFSGIGIALIAFTIVLVTIVCEHYYSLSSRPGAIVISSEAPVRSGLSDTATKLFSLHEGTKVMVEEQKNGYLKIVFTKGKAGWVKADQVMII